MKRVKTYITLHLKHAEFLQTVDPKAVYDASYIQEILECILKMIDEDEMERVFIPEPSEVKDDNG